MGGVTKICLKNQSENSSKGLIQDISCDNPHNSQITAMEFQSVDLLNIKRSVIRDPP